MTERDPCFHCGEMVAVEARVCPICNRSVLVDLVLDAPVLDGRKRYRLARALVALGPGMPTLAELQEALSRKDGVVAAGVTRAFAARGFQVLEAEGVSSSVTGAAGGGGGRALPWRTIGVAAACLALGVFGVLNWRRSSRGASPPLSASSAPAGGPAAAPARGPGMSIKEIAARALPSTVSIRCPGSVGSGFFVTDELVLTNAHVLCPDARPIDVVRSDGQQQSGVAVQKDALLDLAVIRVPGAAAIPLPLGDAGSLAVGDEVVVIGSPLGLEFTVHGGAISNLSRTVFGLSYLQVEAKVNPGNSGGPVLNDQGEVVGVVSLKHAEGEGIGLALPINYAWSEGRSLVAAPSGLSSAGFAAMKAKADDENQKMRSAFAEAEAMPALLGGYMDTYGRLVVKVGRLSRGMPGFEMVTLKLTRDSEEICTLKGDVNEWKAQAVEPAFDARLRGWMEGNLLDGYLYVGEAPLRVDQCPRERMGRGMELELLGANPLVAKARVN